MYEVLTGIVAKEVLNTLLEVFKGEGRCPPPCVTGYFKEDDHYVCFDNTDFSCFVEQAQTEILALSWCNREIEASEIYFPISEKRFD